jgi:hypothetical protein
VLVTWRYTLRKRRNRSGNPAYLRTTHSRCVILARKVFPSTLRAGRILRVPARPRKIYLKLAGVCVLRSSPASHGISDPQLKMQFRQQSLKPARMSTGFHPHAHLHPLRSQTAIELLRLLALLESQFVRLSSFTIHRAQFVGRPGGNPLLVSCLRLPDSVALC